GGGGDCLAAPAGNRCGCAAAGGEAGGDEDVYLVDRPGVEEAAEHLGAALDQDVRQAAPAQFVEQRRDGGAAGLGGDGEHLAARGPQFLLALLGQRAGGHHHDGGLAGGPHQAAGQRQGAPAVDGGAGRGARPRGGGGPEEV